MRKHSSFCVSMFNFYIFVGDDVLGVPFALKFEIQSLFVCHIKVFFRDAEDVVPYEQFKPTQISFKLNQVKGFSKQKQLFILHLLKKY